MPSSLTGLVLFAAFVLPGYVWMRVEETRRPRPNRSGLTEAADLVFIGLIATTLQALRVHRQRQLEEHMAVGPAWSSDPRDEGLMFTLDDGRAIRPDSCWRMFTRLAKAAGLPHKGGLHVLLRHSYATAALRAGVSPEVVSARVGHAHVATTLSIYAHVTEADDQDAADATAAYLDG